MFKGSDNLKVFSKKETVSFSSGAHGLFDAEIAIFIKYKDYFWNKCILDIGCGAGRTTFYLKNFTDCYVGIDYSPEMIKYCQSRFKKNNLSFIQCDVRDMNIFEAEWYDFVLFSFNGLDYSSHENRIKGLHEINRVLRKGGLFIFSSHNRNYQKARSHPRLQFSLHPIRQARNISNFISSIINYSINQKKQIINKEYAIINDLAINFSLLTYYITPLNQISQLSDTGFETIEMYNGKGEVIDLDLEDRESPFIYYVARKID